MFGQPPRSDSDYWKLVQQAGIEDEENLPTLVGESKDELIDNTLDNSNNFDAHTDFEIVNLLKQISDNVESYSSPDTPSKSTDISSTVATTSTTHDSIRKTGTNHYLSSANKKMKLHQDSLNVIANDFNLNACVAIAIHPVDRTNTNQKYLPCLIIEKTEKHDRFLYKLIC
ncbi:unnamed protein product [Didymodactylos carnosus]|uniref:Uncharacterized protein n=1 Tax=Didymodactylos carnosus TaxID=1234261 RepID=A0A816BJU2_9BILA|nr:unnamed protein product [Didymodactylos carnosus]CAF1608608.1 unnamed protein product [Didymodactylos carnosus]CAF4314010.1 unnamed protein product [Didymodactylos carnosus]CAF4490151.1 unnamed protein product [Didymodactylos carnosus]